jgi:hypothetical protein
VRYLRLSLKYLTLWGVGGPTLLQLVLVIADSALSDLLLLIGGNNLLLAYQKKKALSITILPQTTLFSGSFYARNFYKCERAGN